MEDLRVESFDRITCQRPAKDLTEREEMRRRERRWEMRSRLLAWDGGGSLVGCIWGCTEELGS